MPKLAELDVSIAMKGWEAMKKQLGEAKEMLTTVETGIDKIAKVSGRAFTYASASIMGFVTAGLRGTYEGERLAFQMDKLSKGIAAIFLPTIQQVSKYLQQAVDWFQSLTREQQDSYRKWILIGLGVLLVVSKIPTLISALGAVRTALVALGPAGAPLVALTAAMVALGVATFRSMQQMDEMKAKLASFKKGDMTREDFDKGKLAETLLGIKDPEKRKAAIEQHRKELLEEQADLKKQREAMSKTRQTLGPWLEDTGLIGESAAGVIMRRGAEIQRQLAILDMIEKGQKPRDTGGAHRLTLMPTRTGFEALGAAYGHNQMAALKATMGSLDPANQTMLNTKKTADAAERTADAIEKLKPAVAK